MPISAYFVPSIHCIPSLFLPCSSVSLDYSSPYITGCLILSRPTGSPVGGLVDLPLPLRCFLHSRRLVSPVTSYSNPLHPLTRSILSITPILHSTSHLLYWSLSVRSSQVFANTKNSTIEPTILLTAAPQETSESLFESTGHARKLLGHSRHDFRLLFHWLSVFQFPKSLVLRLIFA